MQHLSFNEAAHVRSEAVNCSDALDQLRFELLSVWCEREGQHPMNEGSDYNKFLVGGVPRVVMDGEENVGVSIPSSNSSWHNSMVRSR